jgi:hypothetical protein
MSSLIDLDINIEEMEEFVPLPEGQYLAHIRSVEVATSEKIPEGFLKVVWQIDVDQYPADYDVANNPEGTLLTYARVRLPNSQNRRSVNGFREFLATINVKAKGSTFDFEKWIGNEALLLLKRDMYQGMPTNQIAAISPKPSI